MKCKCGNFMQLINGHWICSCGHKIKYCEEITAGLNALASEIHDNAADKGFYDTPPETGTSLMLIVSELGEAMEAHRKGDLGNIVNFNNMIKSGYSFKESFEANIKDSYPDELTDVLIRLLDYMKFIGMDIDRHTKLKMRYNSTRERLHGKRY